MTSPLPLNGRDLWCKLPPCGWCNAAESQEPNLAHVVVGEEVITEQLQVLRDVKVGDGLQSLALDRLPVVRLRSVDLLSVQPQVPAMLCK